MAAGLLLQLCTPASGFSKVGSAFVPSAGLQAGFNARRAARACPASSSLWMEAPRLGSVKMAQCKKLCPGCEPWICPLAPQQEDGDPATATPHSESAARLLELMREDELRVEKVRLEQVLVGVEEIESKAEWDAAVAQTTREDKIAVVFWGGSWCRKCMVIKPKFVQLAASLGKELPGKLRFFYADARAVSKSVIPISNAVPTPRRLPASKASPIPWRLTGCRSREV